MALRSYDLYACYMSGTEAPAHSDYICVPMQDASIGIMAITALWR